MRAMRRRFSELPSAVVTRLGSCTGRDGVLRLDAAVFEFEPQTVAFASEDFTVGFFGADGAFAIPGYC